MDEKRQIFTLSDLGKSLRSVIERNYTATYWIKAEIAKLNYYPRSGHCYPELVHKTENTIHAQMRATIWNTDFQKIQKQFLEFTGEPLRESMSILFRASVTYHPIHGLSLQIWEIEPTFTLGEMAAAKVHTMQKLREEGVFDQNKSIELPLLPKRIAVISVETSKGYHDFLNILKSQASQFAIWHFLFPTVLQGEKAAEGIISQLRIIKKALARFDIVAIIRGGGGDIGLSCYDDYYLAREIAMFPLPVISGIGHSTNETIAEMVSWANKITPTDVAYFIISRFKEFESRINQASTSLTSHSFRIIEKQKQRLSILEDKQRTASTRFITSQKEFIKNAANTTAIHSARICRRNSQMVDKIAYTIADKPSKNIISQRVRLQMQTHMLSNVVNHRFKKDKERNAFYTSKISLLHPDNVLARGYSITTKDGVRIIDASQLAEGDILHTLLKVGEVQSKVTGKS